MNEETIELQNEAFRSLAQAPDEEINRDLLQKLDYLLDVMASQVLVARRAIDTMEQRRRTFLAMRNEVEQRVKKKEARSGSPS